MAVVSPSPERPHVAADDKPRFRPDIDGLRAVAILAVVGFHVGLPGFGGGYVGVDVFFAISGWLITRNLLFESSSTGRTRLLEFWARRIRRLVPAMALMVVVVLGLSTVVFTPIDWTSIATQGRAAALYFSNVTFARADTGYFAVGLEDSPFLHTWSLAVEEQFYLVWPVVIALAAAGARSVKVPLRTVLLVLFGVTSLASLALCAVLTSRNSPWAFFSLPTRAWEFCLAGLLAAFPLRKALSSRARIVVAVAGLLAIAAATIWLDASTPYPGLWGLLPVVGALAVITAGEGGTSMATMALSWRPMRWIGRVSYSWYLWHWPAIVLVAVVMERASVPAAFVAAMGSLVVAALVYRFFERPIRFNPALSRSWRRTFAMGAAATAVAVVCAFGVSRAATAKLTASPYRQLAEARQSFEQNFTCPDVRHSTSGIEFCGYGDPDAERTVLLMGDSHAWHWEEAFGAAADTKGIQLAVRYFSSCPAMPVHIELTNAAECEAYRQDTLALIDELQPDGVVIASSHGYDSPTFWPAGQGDDDTIRDTWANALSAELDSLSGQGIPTGVILGAPTMPTNVIDCIAEHGTCDFPRSAVTGIDGPLSHAERAVLLSHPDVVALDAAQGICDDEECHTQVDGVVVYVDSNHLSAAFTNGHADEIDRFLDQLLAGR